MEKGMKKKYFKIKGIRIAHKGDIGFLDRHWILGMVDAGIISGALKNGGWWIISRN